ncbi:MAG: translational machinery protein [Burkholderiaceae bacterium]
MIDFTVDDAHKVAVHQRGGHRQVHHRSGTIGAGHAPEDFAFFDEIVEAVGDAHEVLLVGPGQAKLALRHYVEQHRKEFARRVVGLESIDHPSDGELLGFAKKYFVKVDSMLGTGGLERQR